MEDYLPNVEMLISCSSRSRNTFLGTIDREKKNPSSWNLHNWCSWKKSPKQKQKKKKTDCSKSQTTYQTMPVIYYGVTLQTQQKKNAKEPMNVKLFYDSFILHSQRQQNQTICYYIHAAVFLYFSPFPLASSPLCHGSIPALIKPKSFFGCQLSVYGWMGRARSLCRWAG